MFLQNMAASGIQVLTLFLLAAVGFITDKLGVYTAKTAKASTNLIFYAVTPSVIINSFLTMEYTAENLKYFFIAFACGMCTHFVGIALSAPFFRKHTPPVGSVYKFASIFGNMGYMCLPLAEKVVGTQGVFLCSSAVVSYNIMAFTYGVRVMSGTDENGKKAPFHIKSILLNPGVIAVLIGLPLYIFSVRLPGPLADAIGYVASLNSPLAMIILGTYIANSDFKKLFTQKEHYLIVLLKQICMPLIMITAYRFLGLSGAVLTACGISASAPTAANTVMFAAKYDKDTAAASQVVAFGTLMAVLTMPFMIAYTKI
ncbi:MAG: AEC family transporter [Clostridia bacterium]|nr:AEC family transporter [Clostridia bacterium]